MSQSPHRKNESETLTKQIFKNAVALYVNDECLPLAMRTHQLKFFQFQACMIYF